MRFRITITKIPGTGTLRMVTATVDSLIITTFTWGPITCTTTLSLGQLTVIITKQASSTTTTTGNEERGQKERMPQWGKTTSDQNRNLKAGTTGGAWTPPLRR